MRTGEAVSPFQKLAAEAERGRKEKGNRRKRVSKPIQKTQKLQS